jgi:putative nucleotidyltransferase with HDIG domain
MHRDIPTTAECEAMLEQHRVPETRRSHSRRVAELAGKFAEALVATGLAVDPELARAGGLLHDIAKGQPKHAETGAAIVRDYGMPRLAAIVAAHMKMDFTGTVDERAIVYLADKLVAGDQRVTLDERFRLALLRFRDNREAREGAQRRKAVAEQIATAIEARVGTPLDAIAAEVAP